MTVEAASRFFAFLSLLCVGGTVAIAVGAVALRLAGGPPWLVRVRDDLGRAALGVAAAIAVVATLGSLYYSEVQGFVPCELCWIQRICMYPLAVLLTIAAVRGDVGIRTYAWPLCLVGTGFASYHTWLQAFPEGSSGFCTLEAPCTVRHVWELGFVSLPFMALSAFVAIATLLAVARPPAPEVDRDDPGADLEEIPA